MEQTDAAPAPAPEGTGPARVDSGSPRDGTARPVPGGDGRRRVLAAGAVGAVLAWLLFVVVLTYGTGDLVHREVFGGFYEAQTRALLDGRLDVDPDAVRFEGFVMDDGRVQMYQGLLPSIGRLPVMVVTDRFDGRLTGVSMALGMAVALAYLVRLVWVARRLVRGAAPVGRAEAVGAAVLTFGLGASPLLFLAGKAWVYHEALLWGAALSIGALVHLLTWLADVRTPEGPGAAGRRVGLRPLALAAVLALLACHARFPLGLGAVAAVGGVGAAVAVGALLARRRAGPPAAPGAPGAPGAPEGVAAAAGRAVGGAALRWERLTGVAAPARPWPAVAVAVGGSLVALASYAVVNGARFGTAFGVPIQRQGVATFDPGFLAALGANDGSLFGLQYLPSQALQVLRPDAIGLRSTFPFLGFPEQRPTVVGGAVFAERDWAASLPASAPLLFVLGLVGVVALVAARRCSEGGGAAAARVPVLGAAASAAGFGVIGYIAHRYLVDITPMLVVLAAVGAAVVARAVAAAPEASGARWRAASLALLVVLAGWGAWANAALALQYQREVAAGAWEGSRAGWVGLQADLGPTPQVDRLPAGSPLPPPGPVGALVEVGGCGGLYRSNDRIWLLVEGGAETGSYELTLTRGAGLDAPVAVLAATGPAGSNELLVEPAPTPDGAGNDGELVRFVARVTAPDGTVSRTFPGSPLPLPVGGSLTVRTELDARTGFVQVRGDGGDELFSATTALAPVGAPVPVGAPGQLDVVGAPLPTPVCDRL